MKIVKVRYGEAAQWASVEGFIYCGRDFGGFKPVGLGNPIVPGKRCQICNQVHGKHETLPCFEKWALGELEEETKFAEMFRTLKHTSILGCWCTHDPMPEMTRKTEEVCHCQVIARLWREGETIGRSE